MNKRNVIICPHLKCPAGIRKKLIFDHGAEFCSSDIEQLRSLLQTYFKVTEAQDPMCKGQIESFFRLASKLGLLEKPKEET